MTLGCEWSEKASEGLQVYLGKGIVNSKMGSPMGLLTGLTMVEDQPVLLTLVNLLF